LEAGCLAGGWSFPGWVRAPGAWDRRWEPHQVTPWPPRDHLHQGDVAGNVSLPPLAALRAPLGVASLCFTRHPVDLAAPAEALTATLLYVEAHIGEEWAAPRSPRNLQWPRPDEAEDRFWQALSSMVADLDPDVLLIPHCDYYFGPCLLQAASSITGLGRHWGRVPGVERSQDYTGLAAKYGARWALSQLTAGRIVCDPLALAEEISGVGGGLHHCIPMFHLDPVGSAAADRPPGDTQQGAAALLTTLMTTRMLDYSALLSRSLHVGWQVALTPNSRSRLAEGALAWACHEVGMVAPDAQADDDRDTDDALVEGADHVEPVLGTHRGSTLKLDFKSTYPSVVVSQGLCFSARQDVLPAYMKRLIALRDQAKQHKTRASGSGGGREAAYWHAGQLALKAAANAALGCLGSSFFRFRCRPIYGAILQGGRDALQAAQQLVREHTPVANARILYGVTDSVFVHLPQTGREKAFQIARDLTEGRTVGGLELEIEGVFTALQITQLNLYAGWLHVGPQDTVGRAEMRGTIGRQITTAPFIARAEERAVRTWALQPNPHTDGDEAPPGPDQWELVTGWSRATAGEAGGEVAQELITGGLPLRDGLMGKASRLVPHIKVGADGRLRPLAGAPWSEVNVEAYMSLGKLAASGVAAETLPGGAVTCRPRRGGGGGSPPLHAHASANRGGKRWPEVRPNLLGWPSPR
jgi:hypothetical protein